MATLAGRISKIGSPAGTAQPQGLIWLVQNENTATEVVISIDTTQAAKWDTALRAQSQQNPIEIITGAGGAGTFANPFPLSAIRMV